MRHRPPIHHRCTSRYLFTWRVSIISKANERWHARFRARIDEMPEREDRLAGPCGNAIKNDAPAPFRQAGVGPHGTAHLGQGRCKGDGASGRWRRWSISNVLGQHLLSRKHSIVRENRWEIVRRAFPPGSLDKILMLEAPRAPPLKGHGALIYGPLRRTNSPASLKENLEDAGVRCDELWERLHQSLHNHDERASPAPMRDRSDPGCNMGQIMDARGP